MALGSTDDLSARLLRLSTSDRASPSKQVMKEDMYVGTSLYQQTPHVCGTLTGAWGTWSNHPTTRCAVLLLTSLRWARLRRRASAGGRPSAS